MICRALDTAKGQIIAIVVGALLVTHGVIVASLMLLRPEVPPVPHGPWSEALQTRAIIRALQAASPADRSRIAEAISSDDLHVMIGSLPCHHIALSSSAKAEQLILRSLLGSGFSSISVGQCMSEAGTREVVTRIELPLDNTTATIESSRKSSWPHIIFLTMPLIVALSCTLVLVIALSVWTLWRVNRPLSVLAGRVERFGEDTAIAPLEIKGSIEIRQVAQAFNRMQERIARSLEERKRVLMAVAHDLRTPLTRMRLRLEIDKPHASRREWLRDLDLMQKMVDGALSYLTDQSDCEPLEIVDLGTLIESVCMEFADTGEDVTYAGGYGCECRCQVVAITRAVSNLIANGCRYGTHVIADVRCENEVAVIEIRDDGPGIPQAMRDVALLPFSRLDPARAAEGSLGLGLTIVQDVVRRHGGALDLSGACPTGLVVRIVLPIEPDGRPTDPDGTSEVDIVQAQ